MGVIIFLLPDFDHISMIKHCRNRIETHPCFNQHHSPCWSYHLHQGQTYELRLKIIQKARITVARHLTKILHDQPKTTCAFHSFWWFYSHTPRFKLDWFFGDKCLYLMYRHLSVWWLPKALLSTWLNELGGVLYVRKPMLSCQWKLLLWP